MSIRSLAALLIFSAALSSSSARAACTFRLDVLDVGQGDATFIQTPDCRTALIDGGDAGSGNVIRNHLEGLGVSALDLVVVSHYHQDHLAGVVELGSGSKPVAVAAVVDRGGSYSSSTFQSYSQLYAGKRRTAKVGEVIGLGSQVTLTVVSVNGNGLSATDENSLSVGVKLTYGELDVLIAGDLTGYSGGGAQDLEGRIAPGIGPVEIYHVNHHGSAESSNNTLLGILNPDVCLISCGWDNDYGHPTDEALERLLETGAEVYLTEDPVLQRALGTITVTSSDGLLYTVSQPGWSERFVARADAPGQVKGPAAVTVYRGTSTSSSVTPLGADDGSVWQTSASSKSGSYQVDWAARVELGAVKASRLAVVLNGRYSTTRTQTVSAWAPAEGKWVTLGSATVGTSDTTLRYDLYDPARFMTEGGSIQVRVTASTRSSSYKTYADALFVVWEP